MYAINLILILTTLPALSVSTVPTRQTPQPTTPPSLNLNPACLSVGTALYICESLTSSFTALNPSEQAPCLCYSSTSWMPDIFDGAVQTCADFAVTAVPDAVEDLNGLRGFCGALGDVLADVSRSSKVVSVVVVSTTTTVTEVEISPTRTSTAVLGSIWTTSTEVVATSTTTVGNVGVSSRFELSTVKSIVQASSAATATFSSLPSASTLSELSKSTSSTSSAEPISVISPNWSQKSSSSSSYSVILSSRPSTSSSETTFSSKHSSITSSTSYTTSAEISHISSTVSYTSTYITQAISTTTVTSTSTSISSDHGGGTPSTSTKASHSTTTQATSSTKFTSEPSTKTHTVETHTASPTTTPSQASSSDYHPIIWKDYDVIILSFLLAVGITSFMVTAALLRKWFTSLSPAVSPRKKTSSMGSLADTEVEWLSRL